MTKLDTQKTTQVAVACRQMGIKVTSAVHAAIVRVTARFTQHPLSKCFVAFVPVDLRYALDETSTSETKAISKVVRLFTKSFKEIARDFAIVYVRDLIRFWSPLLIAENRAGEFQESIGLLDLAEPYMQRTTALFNAPVPEGFPLFRPQNSAVLARWSLLFTKEYVDESRDRDKSPKLEIVDFWVGTEMLTRNVQFHVWSWDGSLRLGASFNTSFYDKEFVNEIPSTSVKLWQVLLCVSMYSCLTRCS
ncbi:hypothetical protein F5B22DRAFT_33174 [Xylaria bambusicola]|uniref:uncharacterized protein n=1 Tax=Xylaria bambusicola TaxID=326684 RepID=UPI0020080C37|nr:uncharacterized protein F5B22DRAFT_33174 [Xylaria bambusicola]KAI0520977.1 hypothetical protein F5B22DRAFT_33174 [Xylaria bambusicola]